MRRLTAMRVRGRHEDTRVFLQTPRPVCGVLFGLSGKDGFREDLRGGSRGAGLLPGGVGVGSKGGVKEWIPKFLFGASIAAVFIWAAVLACGNGC